MGVTRRMGTGFVVCLALGLAVLGGCGDDDDDGGGGGGGGSDVQAYCDLAAAAGQGEAGASEDQLDQLLEAAPDEIQDDVQTVVEAIQSGDAEAVSAPEVTEASENITQFEQENCASDST